MPHEVEAWTPNHWTAREVPRLSLLNKDSSLVECVQSYCDSVSENYSSFGALKSVISRNKRMCFAVFLTAQNVYFLWELIF